MRTGQVTASSLEAIALRLEAVTSRRGVIATGGSHRLHTRCKLEATAIRFEAVASGWGACAPGQGIIGAHRSGSSAQTDLDHLCTRGANI